MNQRSDRAEMPLPATLATPQTRSVQLLLASRIPARVAWVDPTDQPRAAPLWFNWTGTELTMSTFAGSKKALEIVEGSTVAVTIDTEAFPYRSLGLRGVVALEPSDGLTDDYRRAAQRYLGEEPGRQWCERLEGLDQVLLRVRPTTAWASDMSDATYLTEPVHPT